MKKIKNFSSFINEELNPDTYRSAAEKLKGKGHSNRSKELYKFANELKNKISPIDIEVNGKNYTLTADNFILNDNDTDEDSYILITFDREYYDNLDDNVEAIWDSSSEKEKEDFVKSFSINRETADLDWPLLTKDEQEMFSEWADMNQGGVGISIHRKVNKHSPITNTEFSVDGTPINRKNAVKLLKLIRDYANSIGGVIKEQLNKLTVNDLYSD